LEWLERCRLDTLGNHLTDRRSAFAAIEGAAMVGLNRFWAACTGIDGVADAGIINASANANDHGSQLAGLRMIVNQKRCI
tara:strand:+ start:887 stop:1126 length:240 start_codon:yes stop_codon:yes gene_type:complete